MLSIYIFRKKKKLYTCAILRLGKKGVGSGGGGGGGFDFIWEPFQSALSKITKYFAFRIFILVKKK